MKTIKFGIIGAGLMGREFASATSRWCHLTEINAKPELVAVCDKNPALYPWYQNRQDRGISSEGFEPSDFAGILVSGCDCCSSDGNPDYLQIPIVDCYVDGRHFAFDSCGCRFGYNVPS